MYLRFIFFFYTLLAHNLVFGQTLNVCLDSPVIENDLHKAVDTSSVEVFHKKIYESLIQFNKNEKGFFTLIAENISFPSMKSVLIELKKDISFHDNHIFKPTRKLNADDIIFSFERQMLKNNSDTKEQRAFSNFRSRDLDHKFLSIQKIDSHKILINTDSKIHNIFELLSEHFLSIFSHEYYLKLKKHKKEKLLSEFPIGTGPFQYPKQKTKDQETIRLKTFKNYHGKKPNYSGIDFMVLTDNEMRARYTNEGRCHITHNPSWALLKDLSNNPNFTVLSYEENNMLFLSLNLSKKIFQNKNLITAISKSLNYDLYLQKLFFGHAKRADHILTPNFPEYNHDFLPNHYNPDEAKIAFAQSGLEDITLNLWAITVPRLYIPDGVLLAQLIKEDLEKIGIKVNIVKKPFKEYLELTGLGEHDLAIGGFANLTDEEEILLSLGCNSLKTNSNRSRWCNQKFDQLMGMYFATKNKKTRDALLKQAMLIFNIEKPRIPIAYMAKKKVVSKTILNYDQSHDSAGDYNQIIFVNSLFKGLKKKAPSY